MDKLERKNGKIGALITTIIMTFVIIVMAILVYFFIKLIVYPYFSSRKTSDSSYEYGDFIYEKDDKNKVCFIIGLSEEGKQKKEVVIPCICKYNDYPVNSIGTIHFYNRQIGSFESDKLEIIYLESKIELIGYKLFEKCPKLEKIICLSQDEPIINDELYYLDFYDGGLIDDMPWTPVKDGYAFIGWYKEKECINKWDFDKDEVSKVEYKEVAISAGKKIYDCIYYITRIYAKWEKNEKNN